MRSFFIVSYKRIILSIASLFVFICTTGLASQNFSSAKTRSLEALCRGNKDSHKEATLLIQQGANVCYQDAMGISLSHYAAEKGNLNILSLLGCEGANLCAGDYMGRTPLSLASAQGHIKIIDYINKRTGLHQVDNYGNGPLHYASSHACPKTIEFLLKASWCLC